MISWLDKLRKGYGRKLAALHKWNGWIVVILSLTGLILFGGFWRGFLGEGRVWIRWIHIVVGIASLVPVLYYLILAGRHWKQLKGKPKQRGNVFVVLGLLLGWLVSGVLLWQFQAVGPRISGNALLVHDLLTWLGLPYIIYHSITRTKWLKEPHRLTVKTGRVGEGVNPAPAGPQAVYTRRAFIKTAVGAGLAITLGPSFLRWLGNSLGATSPTVDKLVETDGNSMTPLPQPLPASAPPIGGGSTGTFRIYTVTPIPKYNDTNWSFAIDGLVDNKMSWNWEQFVKLKRTVQVSDFHCVTGWSVYKNTWEGIPLKTLLQQAGVQSGATTVKFYSGDGVYTDALTLDQVNQMGDVMVAMLHDGKLIPSDLGGPVRLIVPKMYGYKSVKWLNRIELINEDHIGYWEERGYSVDAWV
ncbi:molybdopterin-dependent oxidoreductase [Paenibacillus humicola]|uniref:molybdopterin-dependent oxidoreductase n=1 Tax=Paenibacillus humicola TaxID=3110540 RepID=UPI00237C4468|nr:molybdopterin-dependent oxidoreductase [Paenibacillus humicola]